MEAIIEINLKSIDAEHICCAIGTNGDALQASNSKKAWMREAFKDGYRFHRLDARGKALIETVPAEKAWCPINAEGWLFIGCFWVSGKFKGQGVAGRLLQQAVEMAKTEGKQGLAALSSSKKQPFLSDPGFFKHKGFQVAHTAPPYFELLALPLQDGAAMPTFKQTVLEPPALGEGLTLYYSHQCPHTFKYVQLLAQVAQKAGVPFTPVLLQTAKQAQTAPSPFTIWALFDNGKFVTNEIFSPAKFEKYLSAR